MIQLVRFIGCYVGRQWVRTSVGMFRNQPVTSWL